MELVEERDGVDATPGRALAGGECELCTLGNENEAAAFLVGVSLSCVADEVREIEKATGWLTGRSLLHAASDSGDALSAYMGSLSKTTFVRGTRKEGCSVSLENIPIKMYNYRSR